MNRDSFFDNLRNEDTVQDALRRQQRQLAYEERVIKRVFSECGIKINGWGRMANMCRQETVQDKLNFAWFNRQFRRFPGHLSGRRIPRLHELTFQDLAKPFKQNRLAKAAVKALAKAEVPYNDTNWVFVFPVVRTFFCAHNFDCPVTGTSFSLRDENNKLALSVTPTHNLFQMIGKDWFEL